MTTRPPSRIVGNFAITNDAGERVTVHCWSTWDQTRGEWFEGAPELKTDHGVTVFDIGQGRYTIGESDEVFTVDDETDDN